MNEVEWLNNNQLSLDIFNKKYRINNESFEEWLDRVSGGTSYVRQLIKDKKFLFGGRILAGRGITGSRKTLSNCYVLPAPKDNIESIFDTAKMIARTYSTGGGCGINISNLRPKDSIVHNAAKTTSGAVSFMDFYSYVTGLIGQQGRRGALMICMDCKHPDIEEFINLKSKQGVCEKANISIMASDEFMEAVVQDRDWVTEFTSPETGTITKIFKARNLLKLLAKRNWEWAEPGILYWDRITHYSMLDNDPNFKFSATNPCQPASATLLTPNGITTMGDIKEGDTIWSSEGWTKVVRKWSTGFKDVYKYRTSRGVFVGTENHRLVSNGTKVEAKECETVDSLTGRYEERDFAFLPNVVMDGLVLGDGYVHKASNFDSEVKNLIIREGKYAFEITTSIKPYELPRKWDIEIPKRFMTADKPTVCSLLRGLYSANGSVINPKNGYSRITYKTSSATLRDQIQILLSSLGIRSYYTTNKPSTVEFSNGTYTCKESYDINITSDRCKFMNLIGFLQEYKVRKVVYGESNSKIGQELIIDKTYLGNEEVFDITVDNETHTYWTGGLNVSNCGELPLPEGGACLLGSLNLSEFVLNPFTPEARVDYDGLEEAVPIAVLGLNEALNENLSTHPLEIQRKAASNWRQIGLGTCGLADMLIKLGITYGSEESIRVADLVYETIAETAVMSSLELAKTAGCYPMCNKEKLVNSSFIKALNLPEDIIKDIKTYGLHNSQLLTCAPTGSIATMLQVSTGVEPNFALKYTRKTQSLNGKDTYYDINAKIVEDFYDSHFMCTEGRHNGLPLPDYFVESKDIVPIDRIRMQGTLQKWIDNSISSTINLPKEATVEDVYNIYVEAWKHGLKGVTVYRSGCYREGILMTKKPETMSMTTAPKRPETLPCDIHKVKVKGENFIVCVGLYDEKPYEVFVFRLKHNVPLVDNKGVITKKSKGVYSLDSSELKIANLLNTDISVEEKAATLYSSMLLRHGITLKYIIKTAKKVNDNIVSFSSAMCRVLAKYVPVTTEGKCPECGADLIHEGGCIHCSQCLYSKCE